MILISGQQERTAFLRRIGKHSRSREGKPVTSVLVA